MGIYKSSQTHACGNWDLGRAIPILGIPFSNFQYCVFVVKLNINLFHSEYVEASRPLKMGNTKTTFAPLLFDSLWIQGSDTGDNKLTNQFSFVERATQTMNCALKVH